MCVCGGVVHHWKGGGGMIMIMRVARVASSASSSMSPPGIIDYFSLGPRLKPKAPVIYVSSKIPRTHSLTGR